MKYIEKHFDDPFIISYENELKDAQMDEASLRDPLVHPNSDGPAIYEMVRSMRTFSGLKDRMYEDQGGICCYCGQKLVFDNHPYQKPYIVEHVCPKTSDRTLAGEYRNLLLSCRMSDEERTPDLYHCDKSKDNRAITYSPLQTECSLRFDYDEFGYVKGNDESARLDCQILNLNAPSLKKRRAAAIDGVIYDLDGNLLSDEILMNIRDAIMRRGTDNGYAEFCFAIYGAINHLLAQE